MSSSLSASSSPQLCSANEIHQQANTLREEGKTLEALNLYNYALVAFQKIQDYKGVLGVLCDRLISWQHLFSHSEDRIYAIFAKNDAKAMLKIAQEHDIHDRDHLLHFLMGKTSMPLNDFERAERAFAQGLSLYPYKDAERGEWFAYHGEAMYKNGKKEEGKALILEGIQEIHNRKNTTDSYRFNVWSSGAYLRLARVLIDDQKAEEALVYLTKAEEIILNDPRLIVRKQHLETLQKKLQQAVSQIHP